MRLNKLYVSISALLLVGSANAADFSGKTYPTTKPTTINHIDHVNDSEKYHGVEEHKHHHSKKHTKVDERAPIAASVLTTKSSHAVVSKINSQSAKSKMSLKAATCDLNALATSNTTTLINQIKAQGTKCVNEIFSADASVQQSVINSAAMEAVANHVLSLNPNYQGGGDDDITALFLYLRAGYYVEFYNSGVSLSSTVTDKVKLAIDAFVNNSHFYDNNDDHGKTLQEVITTMDSAGLQHVYIPVIKQWLSRWNQSYGQSFNMRSAVNGIFTLLFRGQWNNTFKQLVATDTALVNQLRDFALTSWMVSSDSEFMAANAARELARFKSFNGAAIQPAIDSALNTIFTTYQMYGNGDAIWLGAAENANHYGDCNSYNICGFKTTLESLVLNQIHTCSPTIKIRSQSLTSTQQQAACSKLGFEETLFHTKLQTNNQPVADDHNTQLQVNVFGSSNDYKKYAGIIFGISTNNGGMYLEGSPSTPGNIPNFVAYEASYANADHFVWNLEHEYVHYLDGRFDLYGAFNASPETHVWWSEGVAEYISYQDLNANAIATIADGTTFTLQEIFDTTYVGFDTDRIYRWGYLAVRFMFERHWNELNTMLTATRAGNWSTYKSLVDSWAASYEAEFAQWAQQLVIDDANSQPTAEANGRYYGIVNQPVQFSSAGSNDPDGTIVNYLWDFGDGNTSSSANPTHTYTSAGTFSTRLTITDDSGRTDYDRTSAIISEITAPPAMVDACATQAPINTGSLKASEPACVASQSTIWFSVGGFNKHSSAAITIKNGSGNIDMLFSNSTWPNDSNYEASSSNYGNSECIYIDNLTSSNNYWGHLRLTGGGSGATIVVDFNTTGCRQ